MAPWRTASHGGCSCLKRGTPPGSRPAPQDGAGPPPAGPCRCRLRKPPPAAPAEMCGSIDPTDVHEFCVDNSSNGLVVHEFCMDNSDNGLADDASTKRCPMLPCTDSVDAAVTCRKKVRTVPTQTPAPPAPAEWCDSIDPADVFLFGLHSGPNGRVDDAAKRRCPRRLAAGPTRPRFVAKKVRTVPTQTRRRRHWQKRAAASTPPTSTSST
jgi:hypothetical protein